jgi:hypothetical protein
MGYLRWYADNMWLFVPVQSVIKEFLGSIDDYPFQTTGCQPERCRHQLQHPQGGRNNESHREDGGFCTARQLD